MKDHVTLRIYVKMSVTILFNSIFLKVVNGKKQKNV